MTELFSQIQSTLRDIKNIHDIDFQSSRGVQVGSKTYPAMDKKITVGDNFAMHGFDIPFENGHTAEWRIIQDREDKLVHSDIYNMVPLHNPNSVDEPLFNKWFHNPDEGNHENSSLKVEPRNHTNVHETLGRWSLLPNKGLIHIGESEPFTDHGDTTPITRGMTKEELQQHHRRPKTIPSLYRNALIKPPYGPDLIQVSYENAYGHARSKLYNIRTEELRDVWPQK